MRMQRYAITDSAKAGCGVFNVKSEAILGKVGRMTLQLWRTYVYIHRLMH